MLRPPTPLESQMMLLGCGSSGGGASFVGPLDDYTADLAGAWSVARRLLASYTGPLIRIRRSSDNAEIDIGADALGALAEAAITSFVGANSAYVTVIYDQNTGHGHNLTQSTALLQPRIVNAGSLEVGSGGRPMANFTTFGMYLNSNAPAIETNASVLSVVNSLAASARFAGSSRIGQNCLAFTTDPDTYLAEARGVGSTSGVAHGATARVAWKQAGAATRHWQFDAGVEQADNTGALDATFGVTGMFVITFDGASQQGYGTGRISELLTYSATLTQATVQDIQALQEGLN